MARAGAAGEQDLVRWLALVLIVCALGGWALRSKPIEESRLDLARRNDRGSLWASLAAGSGIIPYYLGATTQLGHSDGSPVGDYFLATMRPRPDVPLLRKLATSASTETQSLAVRTLALEALQEQQEARKLLRQCGGDLVVVRSFRCNVYGWLREYDRSADEARLALEVDPDDQSLWSRLGKAQHLMGQFLQATESLTRAGGSGLKLRAWCYYLAGNLDRALQECAALLSQYPDDSDLLHTRGRCKLDRGDLSGALADFTRAAELQPGNPFYHDERGDVLSKLGCPHEAEVAHAKARSLEHL